MITFEHVEVMGWESVIRGIRNPMNSWSESDSYLPSINEILDASVIFDENIRSKIANTINRNEYYQVGDCDLDLMKRLRNAGTDQCNFMRMVTVYVDITAPLYWWYEVAHVINYYNNIDNICMNEFTLEDFSCEYLIADEDITSYAAEWITPKEILKDIIIPTLNYARKEYLKTHDTKYWWQMIQLLPSSYNLKRTVMLNYEVLANIYKSRKNHKLDELSIGFMNWIESLPYSELITGG